MTRRIITAVGIGPGDAALLTPQARQAIAAASVVVGYRPYLEQITPLTAGKTLIEGTMHREVERCVLALESTLRGERVAVVSSGDAGVYGMAGVLLELTAAEQRFAEIEVEVVPGVTAALACAALVGAPFLNDFAVVSLSDLLTPPERIRRRLRVLAEADFAAALYNPASHRRHDMLDFALAEFRRCGGGGLPCALVRDAYRPGQKIMTFPLDEFPAAEVNMTTLVIIGNSQTGTVNGKLFCRRGYREVSDENER